MPLSAVDKFGPYEIVAPLGAGGMGEVYKARDTRLDRSVAIKVLPEHIAKRDDLRQRFEREARAVASVNHPHNCVLHDIGNQDGPVTWSWEYMDGETLAARIERRHAAGSGSEVRHPTRRRPGSRASCGSHASRHQAGEHHAHSRRRESARFRLAKSVSKPGPTDATLTAVLTTEGMVMGTPRYMGAAG